jgi:hypothetical protein
MPGKEMDKKKTKITGMVVTHKIKGANFRDMMRIPDGFSRFSPGFGSLSNEINDLSVL